MCLGDKHEYKKTKKNKKNTWQHLQHYSLTILFDDELSLAKSLWELGEHRHLSALRCTTTLSELRTTLGLCCKIALQPACPHF